MKYSKAILDYDNMEDHLEKLSDEIGINSNKCEGFLEELPKGFTKQEHPKGFDEFILIETSNNHSSAKPQALQSGLLAYQFGNGFLTFQFEDAL